MPPIPQKLATKMLRCEYVEMGKLLSKFLAQQRDNEEGKDRAAKQGRKVMDILTWVQCFSAYVAVMASAEPQEMLAYLNLIV